MFTHQRGELKDLGPELYRFIKREIRASVKELPRSPQHGEGGFLSKLPPEEVIPPVVEAIRNYPAFDPHNSSYRSNAYAILILQYCRGMQQESQHTETLKIAHRYIYDSRSLGCESQHTEVLALAYDQILAGLNEPYPNIKAGCVGALWVVPSKHRDAAVSTVGSVLREMLALVKKGEGSTMQEKGSPPKKLLR